MGIVLLGHYAEVSTQMIASEDNSNYSGGRADVFPNPTRGLINVYLPLSTEGQPSTLSLYNQFGELAYSKPDINTSNSLYHTCDISDLPDGVYYAKLVTKESVRCFKIVKVK